MKDCKLMIFDWNGTLVNDSKLVYHCMVEIFRQFAPTKDPPSFETFQNEIDHANMAEFYYCHGIARTVTLEEMIAAWVPYYQKSIKIYGLQFNAGAISLLSLCVRNSIKLAIVSASADDVVGFLTRHSAYNYFDSIALKTRNKEVALKKTVASCRVLGSQAYYVDDTFDGLSHAKAAGIRTIGFSSGLHTPARVKAAKPDHIVHSLTQIPALISAR